MTNLGYNEKVSSSRPLLSPSLSQSLLGFVLIIAYNNMKNSTYFDYFDFFSTYILVS